MAEKVKKLKRKLYSACVKACENGYHVEICFSKGKTRKEYVFQEWDDVMDFLHKRQFSF